MTFDREPDLDNANVGNHKELFMTAVIRAVIFYLSGPKSCKTGPFFILLFILMIILFAK